MSNQPKKKKRVSSAQGWKGKSKGTELELPSDNVCVVEPVGMQVFLSRGMIPNSLMPLIQEAINKGKPPKMDQLIVDKNTLDQMMKLMDDVVCYVVLEPRVNPIPMDVEGNILPQADRDRELLYVDEVDFLDKTFIFQFVVGGTRDLEQFRQGLSRSMESVQPGSTVENEAERAPQDQG